MRCILSLTTTIFCLLSTDHSSATCANYLRPYKASFFHVFFFGFLALTRYLFPSFYNQFLSICYFTFLLSTLAFYAFREVKNFQLAHWLCNYCYNCTNWINNFLLYQTFKIWTQIIHAKKIACWNYLICRSIWTFVIGNN